MSRNCRGYRHGWTHQARPSSSALSTLKVSIGCRRTPFAGAEDVFIHAQAHRTTRIAPLEPRVGEDAVESFAFRSSFHLLGPGDHHRAHTAGNPTTFGDAGGLPQVLQPGVGAGAQENPV